MSAVVPNLDADPAREFVISRVFDAPRQLVWRMWTDPDQLSQWWGPANFTNPVCALDLRPGGAYRIVMRSADGIEYPMAGKFLEVTRPERLVLTMDCSGHPQEWHDQLNPGRPKGQPNPPVELLQIITFEDVAGKTKLAVRTRFESAWLRDGMLRMGMTAGWSESLDRLGGLLARAP